VGAVDVDAVDVDAVDVDPWWGCLAGRPFLDGRRKIIISQQQRSSNEKEIRTAAEQIRIDSKAGLFGTACPKQRAISEYAYTTADRKNKDGSTDLPWVWLSQIMLAVAVDFASKRTRRNVSTKLIPGRWV
jgi:hypothetical protein